MRSKFLTSRNKIFIGFLAIVLICLGAIVIYQLLNDRLMEMKNDLLKEKNILLEIQKINRIGIISDNQGAYYFLSTSKEKKSQLLLNYNNNVEEVNVELKNFRTMLNRDEDLRALSDFERIWKKDLKANDRAFQLENDGHVEEAKKEFSKISFTDVKVKLASIRDKQMKLVDQKEREIERYDSIIHRMNLGIIVAFMLIAITLGWVLSRKIQLEEHVITQKQFYQNTSHELKTPLMSIQGYAQAILDGTIEREKEAEALKIIISESDRLKRMVSEMLLLSKLENDNSAFEWHHVPVEYLIEESIFRINPLIVEKGVNVRIHPYYVNPSHPPFVKVDPEKCLQALLNLFSNALRHAVQAIDISIFDKGKQVWIDIKDDGAGISEKALPNLFQRFFNGEDGGNGLGLAIALAIIEQFGGSIKAWNDKDGGAVFRITLPTISENRKEVHCGDSFELHLGDE